MSLLSIWPSAIQQGSFERSKLQWRGNRQVKRFVYQVLVYPVYSLEAYIGKLLGSIPDALLHCTYPRDKGDVCDSNPIPEIQHKYEVVATL